jgi:hypothetical protein
MENKIYIATPMYNGMCHGEYAKTLIEINKELDDNNIDHQHNFLYNVSLVHRARNLLVYDFLKSDCSHLLFIDADVIVNAKDIIKLYKEDKDFIGGCYPKKHIDWDKIINAINSGIPKQNLSYYQSDYVFNVFDGENPWFINDTTIRVKNVGTGYMLLKREVFDRLSEYVPSYNHEGTRVKQYFNISIDNDIELSEDYHLCKLWIDLGGDIYIAPYAKAKHIGLFVYG